MNKQIDGVLESGLLKREVPYRTLLPDGYESGGRKFPVLYLLHGVFGDFENWTTLTDIAGLAADHDLIVVMPDGENGWYTNGVNAADRYEDAFILELIPHIDDRFSTIRARNGRAIAGLSMGGYGAFKFGLKYPHLFGFAASISGAFEVTRWSDTARPAEWDRINPTVDKIFGPTGGPVRAANDLFNIVDGISASETADLPEFYFNCGVDDDFIGGNRRFARHLAAADVAYVYEEFSGGHDWEYWSGQAKRLIDISAVKLA